MHLRFRLVAIGSVCLLSACNDPVLTEKDADQDPEPAFVGGDACRDCHAAEFADWQGSHHDLAMQHADSATVLGDFQDATFNYFDTETRFSRRGNDYIVRTAGADGEPADFKVEYTFGVMPLQQYLVALPGGRLQALPFTWDARSAEDGGQRWYHLYPDENVGPDDPLHWTGREQNWNYMCAECHSTNLEVNYDSASDSFSTSWSDINVHCEACHGPGSAHVGQAQADSFENNYGLLVDLDDRGRAAWEMNARTGIAERSEMAMRPPQQPESCGRCHSRRGVITGEYEYGVPLTQTHRVSLLDEALYFDDGQMSTAPSCKAACTRPASAAAIATIRTRWRLSPEMIPIAYARSAICRASSRSQNTIGMNMKAMMQRASIVTCRIRFTWASTLAAITASECRGPTSAWRLLRRTPVTIAIPIRPRHGRQPQRQSGGATSRCVGRILPMRSTRLATDLPIRIFTP
jgi:hypothetical protein